MQNNDIARRLDEVAHLLNEQDDNPYRVQAYRRAAQTLRQLDRPVVELVREHGEAGLRELPGICGSPVRAIFEVLLPRRFLVLVRLPGEGDPRGPRASLPRV